ncbi:hypothetical protein CMO93_00860 [Candidatus Woesearchaeota archaeon]|nr:hypothetical protein [Candidatus Woesearchaeota archaeon]|tara:strand:- start:2176 stop:2889 length:714 start_codon:yes stop_codon:yes gene_type:complete
MKYKNLTIIGTSHIAKQSLEEVQEAIEQDKPDTVAVELDKRRMYSLLSNKKNKASISDIRYIGLKGYLFSLIGGYIQKKLGEKVKISPGSEMLAAVKLAKKNKLKIALIDQDILITLRRFSKYFGFKEFLKIIFVDTFRGLFFREKLIEEYGLGSFDLKKVPDKQTIKKLLRMVKKRYPGLYKVLIEERNEFMASKLIKLMGENEEKKILAVVGAGHEEDILKLIKNPNVSYSFSVG